MAKFDLFSVVVDKEGHLHMIIETKLDASKNGIKYTCFNLLTRDITTVPEGNLQSWNNDRFCQSYWGMMIPNDNLNTITMAIPRIYSNSIIISRCIGIANRDFWATHCMMSIRTYFKDAEDHGLIDEEVYASIEKRLHSIHDNEMPTSNPIPNYKPFI